ncbi:MAG: GNAT family N-acetyltransferase [Desulfarculaceae bacterium]|jgi:ribosomal protein S18 acetylase RimI-like enzyme
MNTKELAGISIQPVKQDHLINAEQLFLKYHYKDFQLHQLSIPKNTMALILRDSLKGDKVFSCALWQEDRMAGLLSARHLPWMSQQFGANMYSLQHMVTDNKQSAYYYTMLAYITGQMDDLDFLDCRVATGDINAIQALEGFGFRFVGNEVYMVRSLEKAPIPENEQVTGCVPCAPPLREKVMDLAIGTHVHNRYMYDPHIPHKDAMEIYSKYMADFAFGPDYRSMVKLSGNRVLGFLFYKVNRNLSERVGKKYASLDFIGVDAKFQNQGIGEELNRAALIDLAMAGATHVVVRTFGNNYPAIRICQKVGFQITASDLHFHLWLRPKARAKLESAADGKPFVSSTSLG